MSTFWSAAVKSITSASERLATDEWRLLRRDVHFVGVAGEVGDEGDASLVLVEDPPSVGSLGFEHVLEEDAARLAQMAFRDCGLVRDGLEDEVRRVDLAVRMRVRDPGRSTFVLEDQHVLDLRKRTEVAMLALPGGDDFLRVFGRHLGKSKVVARTEADHARDTGRRADAIDSWRLLERLGRVFPDARVIVLENIRRREYCGFRVPLDRTLPGQR